MSLKEMIFYDDEDNQIARATVDSQCPDAVINELAHWILEGRRIQGPNKSSDTAEMIGIIKEQQRALEVVLSWMTNANTYEEHEVAQAVFKGLKASGYDQETLDGAALALFRGAARSVDLAKPSEPVSRVSSVMSFDGDPLRSADEF